MLIVDDLLFGLPIKGVQWVLGQLLTLAETEATNEQPIMQAILESELAFEEGRVDKATYEEEQAALMRRLREIRELKKALAEEQAAAAQPRAVGEKKGPISGKTSLEVDLDFGGYGEKK